MGDQPFRIVALADWRVQSYDDLVFYLDQHPNPDLIIYGGDDLERLCNYGIEKIANRSRYGLVGVAGNDDYVPFSDIGEDFPNVYDLHESPIVIGDIGFLGVEGATIKPGPIIYTETEISDHLNKQLAKLMEHNCAKYVIVSHTPPHGILDLSLRHGRNHIGSIALREFINRNGIQYVICGHSHINGGKYELDESTHVFNVASHDDPRSFGRILELNINGDLWEHKFIKTSDFKLAQSELHVLQMVGDKRVKSLNDVGITSFEDINESNREQMLSIPGVGDWHLETDISKALGDENLICYDIETNRECNRIFIIGCYSFETREFFQSFNPDDERECLLQFADYLSKYPKARLISYSKNLFEKRVITERAMAHELTEELSQIKNEIDLGEGIRNIVFGFIPKYDLKSFAKSIGYQWSDSDISGLAVGLAYSDYLDKGIVPDWEAFKQYNKDDVLATKEVIEFLREGG